MGPFVDIQNSLISQYNKVTMTFQEIFEALLFDFLNYLEKRSVECRICLVPSTKDAFHLSGFPQPRYSIESAELANSDYFLQFVQLFPNPAHISINGMTIGLSGADFLFHCVRLGIDGFVFAFVLCFGLKKLVLFCFDFDFDFDT